MRSVCNLSFDSHIAQLKHEREEKTCGLAAEIKLAFQTLSNALYTHPLNSPSVPLTPSVSHPLTFM